MRPSAFLSRGRAERHDTFKYVGLESGQVVPTSASDTASGAATATESYRAALADIRQPASVIRLIARRLRALGPSPDALRLLDVLDRSASRIEAILAPAEAESSSDSPEALGIDLDACATGLGLAVEKALARRPARVHVTSRAIPRAGAIVPRDLIAPLVGALTSQAEALPDGGTLDVLLDGTAQEFSATVTTSPGSRPCRAGLSLPETLHAAEALLVRAAEARGGAVWFAAFEGTVMMRLLVPARGT